MNLATRTTTYAVTEDHKWLASKHGLDSPRPCQLDGAAFGAIYTDGLAKSGTILAKNSSTGRYVPFDNAGSNATNAAVGILYTTIDIRDGSGGFVNSPASILRHCQVVTERLPRTSSQTGGPHANAVTALTDRIIFIS